MLHRDRIAERAEDRRAPYVAAVVGLLVMVLSLSHLVETLNGRLPAMLSVPLRYAAPLQIVNTYGLFAVMTTERIEIVLEGSADGQTWKPYEFKYKPGDLNSAPAWVAPYQPRLDWQMWFAALSNYQTNPWFVSLTLRLLEGSPDVEALLGNKPLPQPTPPLHPRDGLRIHLHGQRNPPPHRRLVEARAPWLIPPGRRIALRRSAVKLT